MLKSKRKNKNVLKEKDIMNYNLELARKFILEVIANPKVLDNIPSGATVVLYPVKV